MTSCDKKTYYSHREAAEVLNYIKYKSHKSKMPRRAYRCEICKLWHLTSLKFNDWEDLSRNESKKRTKRKIK